MGWQDRPYYRDESSEGSWRGMLKYFFGSVPLFTMFGIRVRAHAILLWYVGLVLAFGLGRGFTWQDRVLNVTVLFVIVLLHEFGHCFAARWVGGTAEDILMHPLGGLAMARPPREPWPTFITVAGGPAVNVAMLLVFGTALYFMTGSLPWNPFDYARPMFYFPGWTSAYPYVYWLYQINLTLLAFNLLPIYPLDGGQMLQTMLWPKFGYFKSMLFSCWAGMVCSILGMMVALAAHQWNLSILAIMGFVGCYQMRLLLLAEREEYPDETDYSAAYEPQTPRKKPSNRRALDRARKIVQQHREESIQIDKILAKVSATGMNSLTRAEKKILRKATEQRRRDVEVSS